MRLAAYVIVRDEETSLPLTLESVKPFVDEIVVCDTGSTDKTVDVARAYTDHVILHPKSEEWRADRKSFDFSAARNYALEYLDNLDVDWILSIDADETLEAESGARLKSMLSTVPTGIDCGLVLMVMCHDSGEEYQHFLAERILRNRVGVRFSREMHNVCDTPMDKRVDWPECRLIHNRRYKSADSRLERSKQRLEVAERYFPERIAADPKDGRSMFYLAGTYFDCGRMEEAKTWFERYLEVSEWPHEKYQAAMLLTQCHIGLGNLPGARMVMGKHLTDNWRRAEGFILLGDIAVGEYDWPQAEWWYKAASLKELPIDPLFVEVPAHTWEPHYKLYRVYQEMQQNQKAANHGMAAVELESPKSHEILWWIKNHTAYGETKITCLVDRGQMNFIAPLIAEWAAQGKEVKIATEAKDVPADSEIVWCEWAGPQCVEYTNQGHEANVRIIVRVHGYEIHSGLIPQVNWARVDDVIFVANYLRDMALEECPGLSELCNVYVVPGGVETAKFSIGNAHGTGRFLRKDEPNLDVEEYSQLVRPDGVYQWSRPWEYQWVLDRVCDGGTDKTVVDVGAGRSLLAEAIRDKGIARVYRQDVNEELMIEAAERNPEIPAGTTLEPETYDTVVSVSVLEHVENRQEFINGLYAALKPGGSLLLTWDIPRVQVEEGIELLRNAGFRIDAYEPNQPEEAVAAAYLMDTGWATLQTEFALAIYAVYATKPAAKDGTKIAMACYGNTKKEFPLALQVMAALPKEYTLHIATEFQDPRLEMYFRHMRQAMGLEGRVTVYPWQVDLNAFYADKDFYLSTSMEESFCYALAEGMAAGLTPIIHDWKSASDFYKPEWIWRTVAEARILINRPSRVSQQMRDYAIEHLDIEQNLRRIQRIIRRPRVAVGGDPKFPYAAEHKMLQALRGLGCCVDAPDGTQDLVLELSRKPVTESWRQGAKTVLWIADMLFDTHRCLAPEEQEYRDARAGMLDKFDVVGVLSPNWVPILEAEGAKNVEWMPLMGATPPFRYLPNVEREWDVGFYGVVTPRRATIIEELGKEFDVHILENCWDHEQVNLFINKCKVTVNLHAYGDLRPEWRLAEVGAAGGVVASDALPDCKIDWPNVVQHREGESIVETVRRALTDGPPLHDRAQISNWYWTHFRLDQALERLLERMGL